MTNATLIPDFYDGARLIFEEDADGTFDAVAVDRFGFEFGRAHGKDCAAAERALLAELAKAKAKSTTWL